MDIKLFDINTEKSGHLIIGDGSKTAQIRNDIENNPLKFKGNILKDKKSG